MKRARVPYGRLRSHPIAAVDLVRLAELASAGD